MERMTGANGRVLLTSLLAVFLSSSIVFVCGVLPLPKSQGRIGFLVVTFMLSNVSDEFENPERNSSKKALNFTVLDFTVPVQMAHGDLMKVVPKVPGIGKTNEEPIRFVRSLIARTAKEVSRREGRRALFPLTAIEEMIQQLDNDIAYVPVFCSEVVLL
ncbi:hypothetical protein KIN20_030219 [Parelaphostrongylus tenuis]|uniref:Uncharacterized protein n=1 Tax=Parelaphostrongylus tenuis TaxID=148309 RepID=A0AAD5WG73_PARTN|nr:hypothetical protein KIN20_030219 [Parelaphostrongylus tenuis]